MLFFYKRDKSIILFGAWSGEKFCDNSRYLFQFLSENKEKFGLTNVVWVTRKQEVCSQIISMGYESYMINSKESLFYHKKAGYHIICSFPHDSGIYLGDILGKYSYGAIKINLWHGVGGMKGVARSSNEYKKIRERSPIICEIKEYLQCHCKLFRLIVEPGGWDNCYYLSTTKSETDLLNMRYLLPKNHYIESNFPRNCACVRFTENEIVVKNMMKKFDYIVLYLPTFRSENSPININEIGHKISSTLIENNILWIQKAHSADPSNILSYDLVGNVLSLNSEFDINVIMPDITLLVTDYSSVANDAMYHKKTVLYYVPDYDDYKKGSRGFAINPDDVMCGPKLYTIEQLSDALEKYIFKPESARLSNYESVRNRFWNDIDSMEIIWNDIKRATE